MKVETEREYKESRTDRDHLIAGIVILMPETTAEEMRGSVILVPGSRPCL